MTSLAGLYRGGWARKARLLCECAVTHPGLGKGNPWIGGTLGEAATTAARSATFLGSRYRRIAKRRGKPRALVAVGNSLLTIAYHLLSDPGARYTDLGADYHDHLAPQRRQRQLIRELERLTGQKVTLQQEAAG